MMFKREQGGIAAHEVLAATQQDVTSNQEASGRTGAWYADPFGTSIERWWDGGGWTDQVRGDAGGDRAVPPTGSGGDLGRPVESAVDDAVRAEGTPAAPPVASRATDTVDQRVAEQVYCAECGTALRGAKYCPQCGVVTENATAGVTQVATAGASVAGATTPLVVPEVEPTVVRMRPSAPDGRATVADSDLPQRSARQPEPADGWQAPGPSEPASRSAAGGRRSLLVGLAVGCTLAAVIAVAAIVLIGGSGGRGGPSYLTQARDALAPVVQDNNQLTGALGSLSARNGSTSATASAQAAIGAVGAAQRTLGTLKPDSGDQQFASNAEAAMTSELAWLNAAVEVLASPSSPTLSQLGSLGVDAQTKLAALDTRLPGASSSFPGSTKLIAYAQNKTAAANTKGALTKFSGQVQALLTQSAPAFEQINQLFGQMQTAANGGVADITLAQAESDITTVVSNRTSLAASARTLNAPTPLASSVTSALVAAFDTSLTDDQDISNCLNQANTGTVAFIFEGCLSSTGADAGTATADKQQFLSLYNRLRAHIGEPATTQQF
jgi:hypothetical protein